MHNKFLKSNKIKLNAGFTLIEIMVALSIFMVIMLAAIGSLVVSSDAASKARQTRIVMDSVGFAMENITRNIRMGTKFTCVTNQTIDLSKDPSPANCDGGNFVAFIPAKQPSSSRIGYKRTLRYDTKGPSGASTATLQSCDQTNTCTDIVSPDVDITYLKFFLVGAESSEQVQPNVYILLKGAIKTKGVWNDFAIQTMASQRTSK